jgi:hypothetical protein
MTLTRSHRFLHAALQLTQILKCRTPDDVYSNLYHFPKDLDSIYDRAWERTSGRELAQLSVRTTSAYVGDAC